MERRAGETLATGNIGKERFVEKPGGADEDVSNIGAALACLDMPPAVGEPSRDDLLVETNEFGEAAIARNLFDIRPDFGGWRVFARPIVVGLERKLVLPRQDIDEETGKCVVPSSPTDLAGLLIDGEIDAGTLQRFGHKQPRHAGADDDNSEFAISHPTSQHRPDLRQLQFKAGGRIFNNPEPR